jgi:hypothetical protein
VWKQCALELNGLGESAASCWARNVWEASFIAGTSQILIFNDILTPVGPSVVTTHREDVPLGNLGRSVEVSSQWIV